MKKILLSLLFTLSLSYYSDSLKAQVLCSEQPYAYGFDLQYYCMQQEYLDQDLAFLLDFLFENGNAQNSCSSSGGNSSGNSCGNGSNSGNGGNCGGGNGGGNNDDDDDDDSDGNGEDDNDEENDGGSNGGNCGGGNGGGNNDDDDDDNDDDGEDDDDEENDGGSNGGNCGGGNGGGNNNDDDDNDVDDDDGEGDDDDNNDGGSNGGNCGGGNGGGNNDDDDDDNDDEGEDDEGEDDDDEENDGGSNGGNCGGGNGGGNNNDDDDNDDGEDDDDEDNDGGSNGGNCGGGNGGGNNDDDDDNDDEGEDDDDEDNDGGSNGGNCGGGNGGGNNDDDDDDDNDDDGEDDDDEENDGGSNGGNCGGGIGGGNNDDDDNDDEGEDDDDEENDGGSNGGNCGGGNGGGNNDDDDDNDDEGEGDDDDNNDGGSNGGNCGGGNGGGNNDDDDDDNDDDGEDNDDEENDGGSNGGNCGGGNGGGNNNDDDDDNDDEGEDDDDDDEGEDDDDEENDGGSNGGNCGGGNGGGNSGGNNDDDDDDNDDDDGEGDDDDNNDGGSNGGNCGGGNGGGNNDDDDDDDNDDEGEDDDDEENDGGSNGGGSNDDDDNDDNDGGSGGNGGGSGGNGGGSGGNGGNGGGSGGNGGGSGGNGGGSGGVLTINCPSDFTSDCLNGADPSLTGFPAFNVANSVMTYQDEIVSVSCPYMIIRHWTVTDPSGNVATCDQTIVLFDITAPSFDGVPTHIVVSCDGEIPAINVIDACSYSDVTVTYVDAEFSGTCYPSIQRTYTASDFCGNTAEFVQFISIVDTIAPVISGLQPNVTYQCGVLSMDQPIISDNCSADVSVTYDESTQTAGCDQWITRTWTAVDQCGNGTTFTQTIHVADTESPVFVFVPEDVQLFCGSEIPASSATATDNCGSVIVSSMDIVQNIPGTCQSVVRVFRAIDECGNEAVAQQTFTFVDDVAPVLNSTPSDIQGDCSIVTIIPVVTATDNCDLNVQVNFVESTVVEGCYTYIYRTWSAVDQCGNSTVHEQVITLIDTAPPVVGGQAEITVSCEDVMSVGINAEDACTGDVLLTYEDIISGDGCNYDLQRTWTAADACGNATTFVQIIHVVDNEAPVFGYLPSTIATSCVAPAIQVPAVTDNCTMGIVPTLVETVSGSGCSQVITRTWTAVDACGNSTVRTQVVNVTDNVAPVMVGVPSNMTISCGEIPSAPVVTATDNCTPIVVVNFSESQSGEGCNLHITRTWTAVDECGNAAVASQVIYVNDATPPVWSNIPQDMQLGCAGQIPAVQEPIATDNCDNNLMLDYVEFYEGTSCGQVLHRLWTATDQCGNSSSVDQVISFEDVTAPVMNTDAPSVVTAECGAMPSLPVIDVTDDCSSVDIVFYEEVIPGNCPYTVRRIWLAIDGCGNESTWTQDVLVNDQMAPMFVNVPQNIEVECGQPLPSASVQALDNCSSEVIISMQESTTTDGCTDVITRTWTAEDWCGNVSQATQVITIVDTQAPVLSVMPQNVTVSCDNIPSVPVVTAVDGCQGAVEVMFDEQIDQQPVDVTTCGLLTPDSPFGDVVLWLPGLNGISANYQFGAQGGVLIQDQASGTATMTGVVYNETNPQQGWQINLVLVNRRNWSEWSALGRSYKDDYGFGINDYMDWVYYELDPSSTLIGVGDLAGSELQLTHAPWTYYYGFQIGVGANNKNTSYGMSGWLLYSGVVNGASVSGHGDIFTDNDCCPVQNITRTWTALDCSGNMVEHTQVITIGQQPQMMAMYSMAEEPVLKVNHATDWNFELTYRVPESGRIRIDMYNASGQLVEPVFEGEVDGGKDLKLTHLNLGTENGVMFFKLTTQKAAVMTPALMLR